MAVVAPNASPAEILRSLRGAITAARRAYPDVLHVEVQDSHGALWRLATQDAEWTPSDPAALLNHSVESADLDEQNGELRLDLSGGSALKVIPGVHEAEDDPPNWKLLTPDGLALTFGPGGRWQLNRASESTGLSQGQDLNEKVIREGLLSIALHERRAEVMQAEEARRLAREEMVLQLSHRDHIQMLLILAVGFSIVAIAVATAALAVALH